MKPFKYTGGACHPARQQFSISHLADLYGVSRSTMRNWLKPFAERIGPRTGYFFSLRQIEIIFECLGAPDPYYLPEHINDDLADKPCSEKE
jgi:hypothetical protein